MKIAAVTVLFNPDIFVLESINSYILQVQKIYLIDNSTIKLDSRIEEFILSNKKIEYFSLKQNKGIAYALNFGSEKSLSENFDWILTMDQDSIVEDSLIEKYYNFIQNNKGVKIGILSPNIHFIATKKPILSDTFSEMDSVLTSGNMLKSSAFIDVGGFDTDLFIDWVDTDICLRLQKLGYKIIRLNFCLIYHQLGNNIEIRFLGRHIMYVTNHNASRYYYKTRNALYLKNRHQTKKTFFINSIITDIFKILFFEKNKISKLKHIYLGYRHYLLNIKGEGVL